MRLDGGLAAPDGVEHLEREGWVFRAFPASNPILARHAEPLLARARLASSASRESQRCQRHATYQARNWLHARRVISEGEVSRYPGQELRDNARDLGFADLMATTVEALVHLSPRGRVTLPAGFRRSLGLR